MNSLTEFFLENEYTEVEINTAMNALQKNGVIADEAVTPGDVYETDAILAVQWLQENL